MGFLRHCSGVRSAHAAFGKFARRHRRGREGQTRTLAVPQVSRFRSHFAFGRRSHALTNPDHNRRRSRHCICFDPKYKRSGPPRGYRRQSRPSNARQSFCAAQARANASANPKIKCCGAPFHHLQVHVRSRLPSRTHGISTNRCISHAAPMHTPTEKQTHRMESVSESRWCQVM